MSVLRRFELEAIRLLTAGRLAPEELAALIGFDGRTSYEHSTGGYYLTLWLSGLRRERVVFHEPIVIGRSGDVVVGFVIFITDDHFTLECHSGCDLDVPDDFRDREVEVSLPKVERTEFETGRWLSFNLEDHQG